MFRQGRRERVRGLARRWGITALAVSLSACGGGNLAQLPPAPVYSGPAVPAGESGQGDPLPPGVTASGPRGTSANGPEGERYDTVGYAGWYESPRLGVAHASLPIGSFVELTALDTGKTVILPVLERLGQTDKIVGLSRASGDLLGVTSTETLPVRVRRVLPSPMDQHALNAGQPAGARPDTPPVLLVPLRHRLPTQSAAPPTPRPKPVAARSIARPAPVKAGASYPEPDRPMASHPAAPRPPVARPAPASGGLYVQVVTLSARSSAQALATKLGGHVSPVGRLWRVRLGPFTDSTEATHARDAAARHGYGDARILRED